MKKMGNKGGSKMFQGAINVGKENRSGSKKTSKK